MPQNSTVSREKVAGKLLEGLRGVVGGEKPAAGPAAAVDPRIDCLRAEISRLIHLHELPDATQRYLELRSIDPQQVLPGQEQLDVANQLMSDKRYTEAAAAYEDFLKHEPSWGQYEQIMLVLALIYARYYPHPERARELFTAALPRLHDPQQRQWAEKELQSLGESLPHPRP